MSLPTFKFTNFGAPTNNESVNSGLSTSSKMAKSGIFSDLKDKAQETFKDISLPTTSGFGFGSSGDSGDSGDSFFTFFTFIKFILVVVIVWFMWTSLSGNGDFHLGMGVVGEKIKSFFKLMEDKGREVVSKFTKTPLPSSTSASNRKQGHDSDSDSDSDSDHENEHVPMRPVPPPHRPPVPPGMSNSSDKKPGFVNEDTKYTFLDKADRNYTGPSPRADDSTSVTQKHQASKAGYCYIGEDRGFRSCVKVEAGDKCMSGQVFSHPEICANPSLRE